MVSYEVAMGLALVAVLLYSGHLRMSEIVASELPELGVEAMWVYHPLVSPRLARIAGLARVELIAWTVDDLPRMQRLRDMGATGLCSNDPRLFAQLAS